MAYILTRVLGFLNVLEPDRRRVSITKSAVWISLFCLTVSTFRSPENFGAAVAGLVPVLVNYAHRYGRRGADDNCDHWQAPQQPQPAPAPSQGGDDDVQPTGGAQ